MASNDLLPTTRCPCPLFVALPQRTPYDEDGADVASPGDLKSESRAMHASPEGAASFALETCAHAFAPRTKTLVRRNC
jgi:hypothetical protein